MSVIDRMVDEIEFQPSDKSHFLDMLRAEMLIWKLNKTPLWRISKRNRIIKKLFGSIDD